MPRYALVDGSKNIVDAFDASNIQEAVKKSLEVSAFGKEVYVHPLTNEMILRHLATTVQKLVLMDEETQQAAVDDFDLAFKDGYLTTMFESLEGK